MYTTVTLGDLNVAYLAEQINNLWRLQWDTEWKKAKQERQAQAQKANNFVRADLKSIAWSSIAKKKKKKQIAGSIGFDPGFTKFILKECIRNKMKKNSKTT